MPLGSVTIAATNVAQKITTNPQRAMLLVFWNSQTHEMWIGDQSVPSDPALTETNGIPLPVGSSYNASGYTSGAEPLNQWYVIGTAGDVLYYRWRPEV